jgi:uncharacterized protein YprB with RNaseH-like and TPR domain
MLKNTFCHIQNIGLATEFKLWNAGIHDWDLFLQSANIPLSKSRIASISRELEQSSKQLANGNPHYFVQHLPVNQYWRLFPRFRDTIAYLDIETTGLENWCNEITTIALYDGQRVHSYVNGQNLDDFVDDIQRFKIIVTYNGRCFDVPFIERYFRIKLDQVHIDLRYVLKSLGFSGGLKGCERQLGIDRGELSGVDGFYAVVLWETYKRTGHQKSLEMLIEYNAMDARNLETLLEMAYERKVQDISAGNGDHFRREHAKNSSTMVGKG